MTLATRCPGCGTSFRVVHDQLKASEGWVRCGRCNEVFNALEALFETDASAPVPAAARARPPPAPAPQGASSSSFESTQAQESIASATDDEDDLLASAGATTPSSSAGEPTPPAPEDSLAFIRRANRAAAWRRPPVRLALLAAAGVLAAALAAQMALLYRDSLAVRWPDSRPLLDAACAWTGCRVEPLRRIGALVVDASGLTPLEGGNGYRLSVVLRNRSDVELLLPAFDLLLTDSQGRTIARRMLDAGELGASSRTVAAGAELALQAGLDAGERRVSGYTIEIFYP